MQNKSYSILINFFSYLVLAILNGYFFAWINESYFNYSNVHENGLSSLSITGKFFMIVVLAPIIETVIFQYIPNEILEGSNLESYFLKIIIPSLLFSLAHIYHPIYMLMTFIAGIMLNKFYIDTKRQTRLFFILTILLHAMYNLYGYLFIM